jgi:hypothetical protein
MLTTPPLRVCVCAQGQSTNKRSFQQPHQPSQSHIQWWYRTDLVRFCLCFFGASSGCLLLFLYFHLVNLSSYSFLCILTRRSYACLGCVAGLLRGNHQHLHKAQRSLLAGCLLWHLMECAYVINTLIAGAQPWAVGVRNSRLCQTAVSVLQKASDICLSVSNAIDSLFSFSPSDVLTGRNLLNSDE